MIVLDTDHLVVLELMRSDVANRLVEGLVHADEDIATTIVSVEEQMRGWLAAIHGAASPQNQIAPYQRLQRLFDFFADWEILPWNQQAADKFEELRKNRVRIGTMDLKIASIALVRDALLLTSNLRDFQRVPGLRVEDWCR